MKVKILGGEIEDKRRTFRIDGGEQVLDSVIYKVQLGEFCDSQHR